MQKNVKYGIAYLLPLIGPLAFLLLMKDNDRQDKGQLGQALILHIVMLIVTAVLGIFALIPIIGILFKLICSILWIIMVIISVLYFLNNTYELPIIFDLGIHITDKL